jgi:ATP-dependent RNA helicase RhlE
LQPTTNEAPTTEGFLRLGVSETMARALTRAGFHEPSPIQEQMIAPALAGRDCVGNAPTGTGKTAAFLIPILERIDDRERRPQVLVLAPTRELVTQICREFEKLCFGRRTRAVAVVGGESIFQQQRLLAMGCQLIVATPGRLMDLMARNTVRLDQVRTVVLDEADQMLDMGFIVPIRRIVKYIPRQRQTLFFSATMPSEIEKLGSEILGPDPVKVSVAPQATTVEKVNQRVLFVEQSRKRALLSELFDDASFKRVIVFTRTKRGADRVARGLEQVGVEAAAIHGDKSQGQRERALAQFKAGEVRVLVATDIAARGIDIDAVSHVVQFELPNVPEAYVHRIGRTARAGADGSAVAFCADDERNLLKDIEKVTRQHIPSFDRRNDRQLGAATAALPDPGGRAERPAQGRHADHRQKQNRNHSAPKGGHRHDGGPARSGGGGEQRQGGDQGQARPQRGGFKGPRRENRGGVWSNH